MKIWALTDGRVGNDRQTLAIAEKFGNYEIKPIEFNRFAALPNLLTSNSSLGIKTEIKPPYPDLVIATGRKLGRVSRLIKKKCGCKIVQLMWPETGINEFDLIFTPKHDEKSAYKNVVETLTPPNKFSPMPKHKNGIAAVLVGDISVKEAEKLAAMLEGNNNILLSTSRRTKPQTIKILQERIIAKDFFEWMEGANNPYEKFLHEAEFILVTQDSISMISDAAHTGKPNFIFEISVSAKHKKFSEQMVKSGVSKYFSGDFYDYNFTPPNSLDFIVENIKKLIKH